MLEERKAVPFLLGEAGKGLRLWRDGTAHLSIGEREEMCFLAPSSASPRPAGGWGRSGAPLGLSQVGMSETSVFVLAALGGTHTVAAWR